MGGSLVDLRRLPTEARREAGFQLDAVQRGFDPTDWKPLPTVGVFERSGSTFVVSAGSSTSRASPTRSMCCIVSRRRVARREKKTWTWRGDAIG